MEPNLQLAESRKYDSSCVWHFAEIKPGLFALYSFDRRGTVLLTEDWNEVLTAYRSRPAYVPTRRLVLDEEVKLGIDISKLEIRL